MCIAVTREEKALLLCFEPVRVKLLLLKVRSEELGVRSDGRGAKFIERPNTPILYNGSCVIYIKFHSVFKFYALYLHF